MRLAELGQADRDEAARILAVCNSCRYCEGVCAVFPAMELRREFGRGDLDYLADLCHACGACFQDCQYAPPHEFAVNVPASFARLRAQSYAHYAWPGTLAGLYRRNGAATAAITALAMTGFLLGFVAAHDKAALFTRDDRFYRLMPHAAMAWLFGLAFVYALLALAMSLRNFWRGIGGGAVTFATLSRAFGDAASLRYLDGGGGGCANSDQPVRAGDSGGHRRLFHHLTFYGFLLCFASTSVATLYHYLLGWEAPYRWFEPPVLLGTLGGLGLVIGTAGLAAANRSRDEMLAGKTGLGAPFLALLGLTGGSGLLLLALRGTPAMGLLLAAHLGLVFALFVTLPYSKFVHGFFRLASLVNYAGEKH